MVLVDDRRHDVCAKVGDLGELPEQFAALGIDADEPLAQEGDVEPCAIGLHGDDRGVFSPLLRGQCALPDCFAGHLIEHNEGGVLTARRADDMIAIDEHGLAVGPVHLLRAALAAIVLDVVLRPLCLAVEGEAVQLTIRCEAIDAVAIDCRRRARARVGEAVVDAHSADGGLPDLLAGPLVKAEANSSLALVVCR